MAQVVPQPLPAAIAADAAAAPQAINQPPTTYETLFAGMGDLYEGAYLPFLGAFAPVAQNVPASVMQTALALATHTGLPGVYVYQAPGTGLIRTVHRLSQTTALPGRASPWDGIIFAFEGDVVPPGLINLVQIPPSPFRLTTAAVPAPTADTLGALWAGLPDGTPCLGPFGANDADVTLVTTRRFMPVPYAYVQFMHNRVLTPRQAWLVAEQIRADGRAADCEIFIDWLRAASTYRAPADANDPPVMSVAHPDQLTVPLADESLRRQVWSWLTADLPALVVRPAAAVENQIAATTGAMRQEFALARATADAARAEAKAPKTMSEAHPTVAPLLRRLCGVEEDADLPTFWKEHATTGGRKHQSLASLQRLVDSRATDPGSSGARIVVSVPLIECITQYRLGSPDTDDLTRGVSPFLICPQFFPGAAGTRHECSTYDLITSGSGAAAMSDIRELADPKLLSPRDALELTCFVGGYSCLLDVLLGENHGAAARLRDHAKFWTHNCHALPNMVGADHLAGFLMRIMRTLQLITIDYINQALQHGDAAALPDYSRIEETVRHRTWQNLSQLPPHYLQEKATKTTAVPPTTTSQPPTKTANTQAPSAVGSGSSSTRPAAVRADAPTSQKNSDWVTKFAESSKTVTALKGEEGRPKVCLSYHLRGTCFEACGERATHRALTNAEKTAMQAFLEKAL